MYGLTDDENILQLLGHNHLITITITLQTLQLCSYYYS